jgi:hypothetical protein
MTDLVKKMVSELEQVCITRLTDVFTTVSLPSQLTKNSDLDSEVKTFVQLYEKKNVMSAQRSGYSSTLVSK